MVAVGKGAADQRIELVLAAVARSDLGDDLLRQDVERLFRDGQAVELAAAHAVDEGRTLNELVARQREEPPLGRAVDGVAGAPDALQEAGDRARRGELADEVDIADIDA